MEVEYEELTRNIINPNQSNIDIQGIYQNQFLVSHFEITILRQWEKAWYLENCLLPHLQSDQHPSIAVVLSTVALLNLKQLEQININTSLSEGLLAKLFRFITQDLLQVFHTLKLEEKQQIYTFLMQMYCQPENKFVQNEAYKFLSSALLLSSDKMFLKLHFLRYPNMIPDYIKISRVKNAQNAVETNFIPALVQDFVKMLFTYPLSETNLKESEEVVQIASQNQFRTFLERNSAPLPTPKQVVETQNDKLLYRIVTKEQMSYLKCIEKFIDLLILLLSSIPTRKYLRIYLLSKNVLAYLKCSLPQYHSCVLNTLVQSFEHYLLYPLNDVDGEPLTYQNQQLIHKDFLKKMQTVLYKKFNFMVQQKELEEFSFVKNLKRPELEKLFEIMTLQFPLELAPQLYAPGKNFDSLILEVIRSSCTVPRSQSVLIDKPLIPNEQMIWDYKRIPEESKSGILKQVLSLPKLNLQFLCFEDYLERNFKLFQLESAFDLRKDFEDVIIRVDPKFDQKGAFVNFQGWAKMATEVVKFRIHEVQTPQIGKKIPRKVFGEIQFSVESMAQNIRKEWDSLKKHQVVFLVSFRKEIDMIEFVQEYNQKQEIIDQIEENEGCKLFCEKYGIRAIRGAEIELVYDERRREILDWEEPDPAKKYQGFLRILHVFLDPAQYKADIDSGLNAEGEIYGNFKLLIRRNPKENNFKAILNSIQSVILNPPSLPQFLQDILLGYGVEDTSSSNYSMNNQTDCSEFNLLDSIIDEQHFKEVITDNGVFNQELKNRIKVNWDQSKIENVNARNTVRFTKPQMASIVGAMYPGLTLIVGPPGTGKTDVAVQIVNLLYRNYPNEKTLVITHSNHALNDIFEKISQLKIHEKHMLRLGIGAKDLKLSKVYSREGRINYMLERRLYLLELMLSLQRCIEVPFAEQYSCEIASQFNKVHIQRLYDIYQQKLKSTEEEHQFPFESFVLKHPKIFEQATTPSEQYSVIQQMFEEIKDSRAFELLRNKKERGNYIICHQAKIIAMTCTHAALKRNSFFEQDFQFDNIIFEEAGQILEIEAFLPLTMSASGRVKRMIMIGDHNQLPPVIKNVSFQKIANMEQSFFIRMIRLGVHHHNLTDQGRTRPSILELYQWKYPLLNSLDACQPAAGNKYNLANTGLSKVCQFVDVDYRGNGENKPIPYFYQNIVEAEFVVAFYMYLIMIGYDPKQITILTTYNGQKLLIKDIINRKCAWHSLFKQPYKVSTVDKYQGQQNDIVLLSMVRTEAPGYLRDIRRIIVALSRAKLGLYIFGKFQVFYKVPELRQSFEQLKPEQLLLLPSEVYPTNRKWNDEGTGSVGVSHPDELYEIVKKQVATLQQLE